MRVGERGILPRAAFAAGALVLSLTLIAGIARAQTKTYVMKITLPTPALHDTVHQVALNWAAAVEKDSGGRSKAQVYPAGQLGSIPRQIESVQSHGAYEAMSAAGKRTAPGPGE